MANSVSTTSGTVVAITGGGIGFALKRLFGEGSTADAEVIVVAALAYAARGGCSPPGWTATCSGRTSTASRPQTREAVRRRGPRTGRRRPARVVRTARPVTRWRRSARTGSSTASRPSRRSCCSGTTSTTRTTSTPGSPGWPRRSRRPAPASSSRRWSRPRSRTRIRKQTWITTCFAMAAAAEAVFVVALSRVAAARRRVRARRRGAGLEDLRRHDRAGPRSTTPTAAGSSRSTTSSSTSRSCRPPRSAPLALPSRRQLARPSTPSSRSATR